jgi:hypothetical protein
MFSSAAHPSWPLRPPSFISFPSIRGQTPGSIDPISLWLIGGDERKVPFDDQLRRSSKILDSVSIDFLTNAWVDWSNFLWLIVGVTGGRFLSMISSTTYPRWPLRPPS